MNATEQTIASLEKLLEDAYEAEALYRNASRQLSSEALTHFFEEDAEERHLFAQKIRRAIFSLEAEPRPTLVEEARDRARSLVQEASENDFRLVEICQKQESDVVVHYDRALSNEELPDETLRLLTWQRRFLTEHLETLSILAETTVAA